MTVVVIDGFETVKVEVQNRHLRIVTAGLAQRHFKTVVEQNAIGQLREGIVIGHRADFRFRALTLKFRSRTGSKHPQHGQDPFGIHKRKP